MCGRYGNASAPLLRFSECQVLLNNTCVNPVTYAGCTPGHLRIQILMMSSTGQILREKRQQLGLSQAKLAGLTGISQHLISAFELGKKGLPDKISAQLKAALDQGDGLASLANRAKRYRAHEYRSVPHLPERVAGAKPTVHNPAYRRRLNDLAVGHTAAKNSGLSALSLFSGCGGFSLGFSAAAFDVRAHLEIDAGLRRVYHRNFPKSRELGGDIVGIDRPTLEGFARSLGRVDVLIGGPPCQGFSLAGKRWVDDPRNALFRHYMAFLGAVRPKVAILENVRKLTSVKTPTGTWVKNEILDEFRTQGYRVRMFDVNAMDYGVPQHRERVLFIAVRDDMRFEPLLPPPTHGHGSTLFSRVDAYRTFGDACSDLPFLESGDSSEDPLHDAVSHPQHVVNWLWDVPEGCSAHDNLDEAQRPPSGYNTTYKRQVWDEPGSTVQTTFGMISGCRNVHPIATRALTVREAARIQSFPDEYHFEGTLGDIRRGIGNAVPPLLAYVLADHTRALLEGG